MELEVNLIRINHILAFPFKDPFSDPWPIITFQIEFFIKDKADRCFYLTMSF